MSGARLWEARVELLSGTTGKILEIGFGTGLNLPHYPPATESITTEDVNPGMQVLAARRIEASSIAADVRVLDGEQLPMEDASFDSVVSTWTLCSIRNAEQALREGFRGLKPGGRFFFLEHGLSHEPAVRRWQNALTPVQRLVADGCHLNRDMKALIGGQGFQFREANEFYMEGVPRPFGYTYRGVAGK